MGPPRCPVQTCRRTAADVVLTAGVDGLYCHIAIPYVPVPDSQQRVSDALSNGVAVLLHNYNDCCRAMDVAMATRDKIGGPFIVHGIFDSPVSQDHPNILKD